MKKTKSKSKNKRRPVNRQPKVRKPQRLPSRPREVYLALRKLLNSANHINARAAELENSLHLLREEERFKVVKELMQALRNSPAGDLVRYSPDSEDPDFDALKKGLIETLVEV